MKKEPNLEDVPRRTRAMQMIGHVLVSSGNNHAIVGEGLEVPVRNPVPPALQSFAPELYDHICKGSDQIARLIASELHRIVGQLKRHRQWDVIYAPAFALYDATRIVAKISDPGL